MPHEPLPVDDFMDQQGVIESGGGEHEQGGIVEEKLNFFLGVVSKGGAGDWYQDGHQRT